jgi:hypothetical protein
MRYKRGTKISLNFRTVSGTKIRFFVQFFGIVPKYPTVNIVQKVLIVKLKIYVLVS